MAQTRGLLLDMAFIKANSPIDNNVEDKLIQPVIWYCQKEYVEKMLGTILYDAIIAEVTTNAGVIPTALYLTLIDEYVADAMLYWVLYEAQVTLLYKYRNKSIGKNTDPNQQPVDFREHEHLRGYYKNKAEYFSKRVYTYLCYNSASYPLWDDCSNTGVNSREVKPSVSIYIGNE